MKLDYKRNYREIMKNPRVYLTSHLVLYDDRESLRPRYDRLARYRVGRKIRDVLLFLYHALAPPGDTFVQKRPRKTTVAGNGRKHKYTLH